MRNNSAALFLQQSDDVSLIDSLFAAHVMNKEMELMLQWMLLSDK